MTPHDSAEQPPADKNDLALSQEQVERLFEFYTPEGVGVWLHAWLRSDLVQRDRMAAALLLDEMGT